MFFFLLWAIFSVFLIKYLNLDPDPYYKSSLIRVRIEKNPARSESGSAKRIHSPVLGFLFLLRRDNDITSRLQIL